MLWDVRTWKLDFGLLFLGFVGRETVSREGVEEVLLLYLSYLCGQRV